MNLLSPIDPSVVLRVAAVLGALTVLAYILKMRRRRFEVPFSTLWHRVLREKEATSLWKHLKRIVSLLLQLVILALLLFAVFDPQLGGQDEDARNVVVIIDASASMKATDEGEAQKFPRIEMAKREARELLASMSGSDAAMLVRMDGQTTPLSRFVSDKAMLRQAVNSLAVSDTPADLERALRAAADALRERQNPTIVIIGDGAYPTEVLERIRIDESVGRELEPGEREALEASRAEPAASADDPGQDDQGGQAPAENATAENAPAEGGDDDAADDTPEVDIGVIDLRGIDVRYIPIGQKSDNVGIVAFNARRYLADKTNYSVLIEVQNFGEKPASRRLVVYNGESAVDVKTLTLEPGQSVREIYPKLSGGVGNRLRAELQPANADEDPDVFPLDDEAFALLPARKRQKVLLVTQDNLYLEGAMLVYDNIQVDKLLPEEYDAQIAAGGLDDYNAVVFDDHTPERLPPPSTHLLYFHPSGEHSPFTIRSTVSGPRVTDVSDNHPVMRWITMSDAHFDESNVYAVDRSRGEVSLARYVRDTIIAAKRDGPRKIVAFGFPLAGTDLTLRVAFPLLLVNTLDWFAGDDADLLTTYRTGRRFRVPLDGVYGINEVEVETPLGERVRAPVTEGMATFYGNWIGIHQLTARDSGEIVAQLELAANLANPNESNIKPRETFVLGERALEPPAAFAASPSRSLWTYLVLLVVLMLCIEWITYNRRITV